MDIEGKVCLAGTVLNLELAPRVSGAQSGGASGFHMFHFPVQQLPGGLGLCDIINSSRSAAPLCLRQFNHLNPGYRLQYLLRLVDHFLTMAQVAGMMICHFSAARTGIPPRGICGYAEFDLREPFMNINHFMVPEVCPVGISGIVFEEVRVMFEMGTAAAGIGDDGVEGFRGKLIDIPAGQFLCEVVFAIVGMQ